MSRIHEALKKAETERVSAQGVQVPNPLPQAAVEAELQKPVPLPAPSQVLATPSRQASATSEVLRLDDIRARCARPAWNPIPSLNAFDPTQDSRGAEQFRTLRSRLYQLRGSQPLRTVLVTSSVATEGKTFVSSNLAHALVRQHDRHVLLIDADLRCSRLHLSLGAPSAPGLSDYLGGSADEYAVIQRGPEENLCFIPGGTQCTNPSELLASGRLKTLLDGVAAGFDWVIIDSPPCLPVADASVLADYCDGVLFVVRAECASSAVVQRARQELQNKKVVGVVLNAVEDDTMAYSYYGSAYYGGGAQASKR